MTEADKILEILKRNKVAKASEFKHIRQSRSTLSLLARSGEVVSLGSGYYSHPSIDPFLASIVAVARYYPEAVLSKATALVIHGLSDERIDRIDVDIKRESSIRNKIIRTHRVAENYLIGIEEIIYQGHKIRIYDRERSLCEGYRMDPDGAIFIKAIKRYTASQKVEFDKIAKYDEKISTKVLRAVRQETSDD